MALIVIPVRTDIFSYTERITLNGSVYVLTFNYNLRMDVWFMDIATAAGTVLLAGIAFLQGLPLTYKNVGRISGLPPGDFVLIDETGQDRDPGKDNLGQDIKLEYLEA